MQDPLLQCFSVSCLLLSCLLLPLKIKISQIKSLLSTLPSGDDDYQSFGTVVIIIRKLDFWGSFKATYYTRVTYSESSFAINR